MQTEDSKRNRSLHLSVIIFFLCKIFQKMYMFTASDINSTAGFSAKFMIVLIRKISAEFHIMAMIGSVRCVFSFAGNCAESMVVAVTIMENTGAAG